MASPPPLAVMLALTLVQVKAIEWAKCGGLPRRFGSETYSIPNCQCDMTLYEIVCGMSEPLLPVRIAIECTSHSFNILAIPYMDFPTSNFTLKELVLTNCEPSTFASLLARFGEDDAVLSEIRLEKPRGELRSEHVKGLVGVRTIVIKDAADQTRIPFDVFDALPALEEFQLIRSSHLQLETSGGDGAPHHALQSLQLLSCGITDVPSDAFARLPNIKELYLGGNSIKSFKSDAFRGLKNLELLSLHSNPLSALPPRAFEFATHLRTLRLDNADLRQVPGDAFEGLKNLELMTFKNDKGPITFGARALAVLPAMKELLIVSTPVDPLPKDLLDGSTALEELVIRDAGIEIIPYGFLSSQHRLKKLDLSGNKLKKLDANVFQSLVALNELNLDRNNIEELSATLFSSLHKIRSVSVNNNKLKYIAVSAFGSNDLLDSLSLNNNQLTSEAFSDLHLSWVMPQLKELLLRGNRLSFVLQDWQRFGKLEKLDLSWNNFTKLKEMHIMFHSIGLVIDLRHNYITNVEMDPILPGLSETDEYITHVLLDNNPFTCDCKLYTFIEALHWSNHHFISALKLDPELAQCATPSTLAGKFIRNLPLSSLICSLPSQDCPANCTCNIRPSNHSLELDCSTEPSEYPNPENHGQESTHLRLRSIQSLSLPYHIVSLNLSGLGLTEAPSLKVLQNIKELDISQNDLTDAPIGLLKSNISLRLANNPFQCDCSNLENLYALQNNAARIVDADNVTCDDGQLLIRADVEKICKVKKSAMVAGVLAGLGLLVAIASGLAYRFNLEIKLFLYSRCWYPWEEEDEDNAIYDAFVSFAQDDAQWVSEQLLPKLEGEPNNFKLCVHYRDWAVGEMIPAQIATSVEQSRRTIVVLTDSFLKSTWAPLEFRAANARARRDIRARVIIIVLGEIPLCEDMDAELRAYLTTNTYLKWGDLWFWEKLKYAMPHRR